MTQDKLGPMHSFTLKGEPYQVQELSDARWSCGPECPLTPAQHAVLYLASSFVNTFLLESMAADTLPLEQLVLASMDFAMDAMRIDPTWCARFERATLAADADTDTERMTASRHLIEHTPLPEEEPK